MKTTRFRPVVIGRRATILLLPLLSACLTGSGRLETKPFALADFDSIEVNRGVQVQMVRGDSFAVSVTADDNVWDALDVSRQDTTLRIELPSDRLLSNVTVRATVSMPVLLSIHASGGAHATFSGFEVSATAGLALHASGASEIEGGTNTDALSLDLSGGSRATLSGATAKATIDGSGGCNANLGNLTAQTADLSLSGNSSGSVTVDRNLDYDLSGASHVVYFGAPQIGKAETSGSSSAQAGGPR